MAAAQTSGTPAPVPAAPAPVAQILPPAPPSLGTGSGDEANLVSDPDFAAALRELEGAEAEAPSGTETEAPKTEPAPPPEPEEAKDPSPEWAKLRAHERRHKERVAKHTEELRAERAKFAAEKEAYEREHGEFKSIKERAKKTPIEALTALGWTLQDLTKYVVANGEVPQEKILADMKMQQDEELKALRAEIESVKKQREDEVRLTERQKMEREAEGYEVKVKDLMQTVYQQDGAKFRYLSRIPQEVAHRKVLDIQLAYYQQTEKALAISDAMLQAERNLAQIYSWVDPNGGPGQAGSVQSVQPVAAKPSQSEAAPIGQRETTVRGIQKVDLDSMTDEERMDRARRILDGEIEPD
jgi:hypothetical protein